MDTATEQYHRENERYFGRLAWVYAWSIKLLAHQRRFVADLIAEFAPKRVLDVATGTGGQSVVLAQRGLEVVGVDLSESMLRQARKHAAGLTNLSLLHTDASHLPFVDDSFDLSTVSHALNDMPHETALAVLREMRRVTKSGGPLVLLDYLQPGITLRSTLVFPFLWLFDTKHYRKFVKQGLRGLVTEAGLTIKAEHRYWGIFQILVVV